MGLCTNNVVDRLSREELYNLVWSRPLQQIAAQFAVSDVWVGKVCRAADVPRPPRGYWAKVRSGKEPRRVPLPPLKHGVNDQVKIRRFTTRKPASEL